MKLNLLRIIALLMVLIIMSCKDDIVDNTPAVNDDNNNSNAVLAKFSDIQSKVLNNSCATSGCHVPGVQNPNLSGNSYSAIVNKQSSSGLNYIEPGEPNNSYLYLKITGGSGISGSRMPLGAPSLSQEVIDSVRTWITNGAVNN